MKNKKGFTLIELLAVIVILAIIALIATPIILNMIEDARKNAAIDSAYGYIEAIEYNNSLSNMDSEKYKKIESGEVSEFDERVNIKGTRPTSGNIKIEKGRVIAANLCINGFWVIYNGKIAEINGNCDENNLNEEEKIKYGATRELPSNGETYKAIVYLDPTNLTNICNNDNTSNTSDKKNGCMKWYAYIDDGVNYKLILDHNTSGNVAWNSSGKNEDGMKEVKQRLIEDTKDWDNEFKAKLDSEGNLVGNATLITADEVADITGASSSSTIKWSSKKTFGTSNIETQASWFYFDGSGTTYSKTNGWQKQIVSTQGASKYGWLYDNVWDCIAYGCNVEDNTKYPYDAQNSDNIYGYWTQTPVNGLSTDAWNVSKYGLLNDGQIDYVNRYGVRPVITISKSIFE